MPGFDQNGTDVLMLYLDRSIGPAAEQRLQRPAMRALVVRNAAQLLLKHREVVRDDRLYLELVPVLTRCHEARIAAAPSRDSIGFLVQAVGTIGPDPTTEAGRPDGRGRDAHTPHRARRKECGRLDRGHSGVLARVLPGRRSKFGDALARVKGGFAVSAAQTPRLAANFDRTRGN